MCSDQSSDENKRFRRGIPCVLAFHKILPRFSYSSTNYSPRRFKRLLAALTDKGYRFAPIDRVVGDVNADRLAITFDDGYQHLVNLLEEVTEETGVLPVIFLPTAFVGKSNRWDYSYTFQALQHLDTGAIAALTRCGVEFGSHGHSHQPLTKLSRQQLAEELRRSRDILQELTGREITRISYPFGAVSRRVLDAAQEAGYRSGFTMSFPTETDIPLARGRYTVYGYDTIFTVMQKIRGGKLYKLERLKAAFTNKLSAGTGIYRRLTSR